MDDYEKYSFQLFCSLGSADFDLVTGSKMTWKISHAEDQEEYKNNSVQVFP